MRKVVLALLLSAFVFITVHDWVIGYMDSDTQKELMLVEHGELQTSMLCDVSEVHQHLHESIISYKIIMDSHIKTVIKKQNPLILEKNMIVSSIILNLYRPPIV